MGELIYKAPEPQPPHYHDYPPITWENIKEYPVGSIWKCECEQQFIVKYMADSWNEWRKYDPNAGTPRTKPQPGLIHTNPKGWSSRFRVT